jgi:hypothetical protein
MTTPNKEAAEREAFKAWAEVRYRNADEYTVRDFNIGLEAWKAARSALTASEAAAQDHVNDAVEMVAQEAQEQSERVRYADSLKEVICKKCELPVISSCSGSGCPVPNMYDRRAAPAQAGMTDSEGTK